MSTYKSRPSRYGVFTRKVWTRRKAKTPLTPQFVMEDKVGLAWLVQRNATQSGFTEDVYGEEEKDPKPQKKTINMATKSSPMLYPK